MVSIIVPVYNEEKVLSENLDGFRQLARHTELIFVDGGSSDSSLRICGNIAKVFTSGRNRAHQMNTGAGAARGDILLFMRADNMIGPEAIYEIERSMHEDGIMGGCLSRKINKKGLIYRLIESVGTARSRLRRVYYVNQGIFVKKALFTFLKGFPEIPEMEDAVFSRKLRGVGRTKLLKKTISVSPARWEDKGAARTVLRDIFLGALLWIKPGSGEIKKYYRDLR